jgi:DNA primase
MAMYSKEDIVRVRSSVSIIDHLQKQGVSFKQSGVNFTALCPLHSERSPSFHVNSAANTFHCFGCGAGGDIIHLVQQMESLSFVGALQYLAEEAGIVLNQQEHDEEYEALKKLYRACDLASRYFREQYIALPEDHPAKLNLYDRGLKDEAAKDVNIGFVPLKGTIEHLRANGVSQDDLVATGLIKINGETGKTSQMFRNRLVWTIRNIQGKAIAFSARKIFDNDMGPKYINSPSTRLYNKSKTLMGAEVAKKHVAKTGKIFIVEGATDIMALREVGFENTVATCGTAFGPDHAQTLLALSNSVKDVDKFRAVFCFDGDAAGLKAAREVFNKNPNIVKFSQVVKFVEGDPVEIRQKYGEEHLIKILTETPLPMMEFILKEDLTTWDVSQPEQLDSYIKNSVSLLRKNVSPVEQEMYIRKLAQWTGLNVETLKNYSPNSQKLKTTPNTAASKNGETVEDTIFALTMQYPNVILPILEEHNVTADMFENPLAAHVIAYAKNEKTNTDDIAKYLVLEHNIHSNISARAETLIKNFIKTMYLEEVQQLESLEDLEEYMTQLEALKQKYSNIL